MDQVEIGKFISECRKEKGLTQAQLAEKLNITNRAISKWETGKSMPDTSVMLEVCGILGISVNELLSGKRLSMENYQKEAEGNLTNLMVKAKNLGKMRVISALLIICGITIGLTFPVILELELLEKIIMCVIGIFVFGCGFVMELLIKKAMYSNQVK